MSTRHSSNSGLCGALPRHRPRPDAGFSRVNFPSHFLTRSALVVTPGHYQTTASRQAAPSRVYFHFPLPCL